MNRGNRLGTVERNVIDAVQAVDNPLEVTPFATMNGWYVGWVSQIITDAQMPGELHGDTYVPKTYMDRQRCAVREFFAINGFVTSHFCKSLGVLPSQMKACMIDEDEAAVLQNIVIHKTRVLEPLRAAVQEAIDSSSWLDLQIYLPLDLLEHHSEDARGLVETVAPNCTASIQAEGALLLSPTMLENAQKNCLPAAIHVLVRKKSQRTLRREGSRVSQYDEG